MKKRILAFVMTVALAVGTASSVFANTEMVNIEKKSVDRYESVKAYSIFDNNEFKLASVLNNAVREKLDTDEKNMSISYKTKSKRIELNYYTYEQIFESGDFVSVVLCSQNYTGGIRDTKWLTAYTGYKNGDTILKLGDLFENRATYKPQFKKIIKNRILADPSSYYQYGATNVDEINIDNNFYIDNNGNIVIFYQPFNISPYDEGIRTFTISAKELINLLKPEVYNSLKGIHDGTDGDIFYNGRNIKLKNDIEISLSGEFYGDTYIPVREVFELMGVEVKWNVENGAVLNNLRVAVEPEKTKDDEKFTYELEAGNIFKDVLPLEYKTVDNVFIQDLYDVKNFNGSLYINFNDFKELLTGGMTAIDHNGKVNIYY